MRAGQDAMKQFDDALASAAGVGGKEANSRGQFFFPFGLIADLQRDYIKQLWRLWNATFLQAFAGGARGFDLATWPSSLLGVPKLTTGFLRGS
jgi:polyhydroxyalkanoate synthase